MDLSIAALAGYVMTLSFYGTSYWLCGYTAREHLRARWVSIALLAMVHALAVFFGVRVFWGIAMVLVLPCIWVLHKMIDIETYKLMYLVLVSTAYTVVCNLIFYLLFGASHLWGGMESVWMLAGFLLTLPPVALFMRRFIWPQLRGLTLRKTRGISFLSALVIIIDLFIASTHMQSQMVGYEWAYGLIAILMVIFSASTCLMLLLVMKKQQAAADHRHILRTIETRITAKRYGPEAALETEKAILAVQPDEAAL